jgi:hypothetical protein
MQCRKIRDVIAHARVVDQKIGIGEMTIRRGNIQEVLMSTDSLNALYDHIQALKQELYSLISWFQAFTSLLGITANNMPIESTLAELTASRIAALQEGVPGFICCRWQRSR